MKKVLRLTLKAITNIVSYTLLLLLTFGASYLMILGSIDGKGHSGSETAFIQCDEDCPALSNGKVEPNGTIWVKRPTLTCTYESITDGPLMQMYWTGPWTDQDGDPLPEKLLAHDYDTHGMWNAKLDENGQPICPDSFNLRYGQRGTIIWRE